MTIGKIVFYSSLVLAISVNILSILVATNQVHFSNRLLLFGVAMLSGLAFSIVCVIAVMRDMK